VTDTELLDLIYDDTPDEPPLYQAVCSFYIGQICEGIIKPGDLLPSSRRAAEKHGVSEATARKGLRLMMHLGWAKSYPGYPFVAAKPEPA
jgi:DNA-binding transcriptional regulator YhcF (GntR family)